ncbi:MAG: hydantoinase/oxoprolinase family protein, partial [Gemmatimonadota bacterium]|nr:hydantoinase/oxoprolinase family protein [Gemmatimonadota bacterium]
MSSQPGTFVAVDTGGTFTDIVAISEGRIRTLKVASTPDDPSRAVRAGVAELVAATDPHVLLHGTTVATNALLERKGARVGLITNRGFEDVLEIGRQNRPQLYALVGHRPPPLAAREDRIGIAGRMDPNGVELEPVDPAELQELVAWARERDSVAVCLLHAYANPEHEEAVAAALADWGGPLSVSSRILPEFREYERTSTVVVNAFVAPVVSGYLRRLEAES